MQNNPQQVNRECCSKCQAFGCKRGWRMEDCPCHTKTPVEEEHKWIKECPRCGGRSWSIPEYICDKCHWQDPTVQSSSTEQTGEEEIANSYYWKGYEKGSTATLAHCIGVIDFYKVEIAKAKYFVSNPSECQDLLSSIITKLTNSKETK